MIQPGIYLGKILNYGIQKTKSEQPEPVMEFGVIGADGTPHRVFWRGSLNNETGIDIALKALIACGLANADDLSALADGPKSGLLDQKKELRLTVVHETYNDRTVAKVKWVNDPAEAAARAAEYMVDKDQAARMLRTIDLRSKFNQLKGGAKSTAQQSSTAFSGSHASLDDVPF